MTKMNQVWENKLENMKLCNDIAKQAVEVNADLLIFPEMTLTGFSLNALDISEDINDSSTLRYFSTKAKETKLLIVAGAVLKKQNLLQNCAIAHNRKGEKVCSYAKIHPFSITGEDQYISGGTEVSFFDFEGIRFGLTICYDLRFPVLWDILSDYSDCIINIANWPAHRLDHWKTLLKARAIENQLYVIGVNRVGSDENHLDYVESSYCFGPDGSELDPIFLSNELSVVEINELTVIECRKNFPVRKDRLKNGYASFANPEVML